MSKDALHVFSLRFLRPLRSPLIRSIYDCALFAHNGCPLDG